MKFLEAFAAEFDEEIQKTRKILERVPGNNWDYKPHDKSMTLNQLASHVSDVPSWIVPTLQQDVLTMGDDWKPFVPKDTKELLAHFDKGVADANAALKTASEDRLGDTWSFQMGGSTVFSAPRWAVLRGMVMNHLVHHRAQLGVYLRLNNVEIPGMYGPSADEMSAFTAQTAAK